MRQLRSLLRLPRRDLALLAAAWAITGISVCLVSTFSIGRTRRILRGLMHLYPQTGATVSAQRVGWAMEKAASVTPRATCLVSALAGQAYLNRLGHSATLCIGATRNGLGGLEAHAWLEDRGDVLVGGPAPRVSGFKRFPGIDEATQ